MTAVLEGAPSGAHRALGLTDEELESIRSRLGREPNHLELAMFGVMWSEHCSYKSSRHLLRTLPTGGPNVVAGPGASTGAVRIGGGLAACFKLESHNHPSAVEPYQGAATGVGGILRDVIAMGARPVAVLDALKFGDPGVPRVRRLVEGVVRGIAGYGNCVGVPTIGGELAFDPTYEDDPLVNVLAVGIVEEGRICRSVAERTGDLVVLYGSATGRDGIGGASVLASANVEAGGAGQRARVQVGDPFAEKLLIEATLELVEGGLVAGLQDLGAAGLSCGISELADAGGSGIVLDLDAVPRRAAGMTPAEVVTSESQERMVAVVRPDDLPAVLETCSRWGLPAAVVGRVTGDGLVRVTAGGVELASVPAHDLASGAIAYDRPARPPARRRAAPAPGVPESAGGGLPDRGMDPGLVLQALLGSPNLGSRAWLTGQYDETVGADTVAGGAHGAAMLRVRGTTGGLVVATDSCPDVAIIAPYLGAQLAVAECARNVAITGAQPLGLTNCLNFGNPERPEEQWALAESVRGLGDACRALGLPVTGGNVSLYNESERGPIAPTVQVGVLGWLEDLALRVEPAFRAAGDVVGLLGEAVPGLAGSAYAALAGAAPDDRPPGIDLDREAGLQALLAAAAGVGLLASAQDVSAGGLAVAVAEAAIWSGLGVELEQPVGSAPAVELFGESPSRVLCSTDSKRWPALLTLAAAHRVPCRRLGTVVDSGRLRIRLVGEGATGAAEERGAGVADELDEPLSELRNAWLRALPRALGQEG